MDVQAQRSGKGAGKPERRLAGRLITGAVLTICVIGSAIIWLVVARQIQFEQNEAVRSAMAQNDDRALMLQQYVSRTLAAADLACLHIAELYSLGAISSGRPQPTLISDPIALDGSFLGLSVVDAAGNTEGAKAALGWVAEKSSDEGLQALARMRLAAILLEAKAYDEALKQLAGEFPTEFEGLAADRRGDIYSAQGKKAEAKAEYTKAFKTMDERTEYRRLVEVKLSALGVDPQQLAAPAAPAASGGAKQ